jgi:hypothetical protein
MAYASITYTSASGTTFALTNSNGDPIPYLRQADISVTVNGVLKTLTTDYTFNTAGTAIVLNTAVSGATVVISRVTDISDATVVYTAGSTLTAQDLNNADNQIRYGLQEFSDTYGSLTTGTGDLSSLGGFIGSAETWVSDNAHAATTGAIDNRVDSKIATNTATVVLRNGTQAMQAALSLGGFKITNLATPTSSTDGATKAYVDSFAPNVAADAAAAAASASAAATSASNAATSETNAANSATSAASSAASALAAFDSFDDRYLGAKATDPTVDNDGDPLNAGDLYYNTTSSVMKVYTGSAWVVAYVPGDAANISFTPYGSISATNVQSAIQEVVDEIVPDKISEGNSSVEVVDTGTGKVVFTVDGSQISEITTAGGYRATGSDVTRLSSNVMVSQLNSTGVTLGVYGGTNNAELRFLGNTVSDWVGFKAPGSLSGAIIWTLPSADGANGQALTSNGSTVLGWSYKKDADISGNVQFTGGQELRIKNGSYLVFEASGTTNYVRFGAPSSIASNITWTLPSADGTNGQLLGTNGTGTLSWQTAAKLDAVQSFTVAQRGTISALTSASTVTPDFAAANNFSITLGHNVTLANPTNLTAGQSGAIFITQNASTAYTMSFGSYWDFSNGTAPSVTSTLSAVDVLVYTVRSSTSIHAQLITNLS